MKYCGKFSALVVGAVINDNRKGDRMGMNQIYGYYNGENIVPSSNLNLKKNQKVLITPVTYLGKITNDNYEILLEALAKGEEVEYEYDDPFFNLENVKALTNTIKEIKNGKAILTEHELIEDDDDA